MMEFEAVLRETSRLTTMCQNEEKLNSAYGPVMRGCLHDRLSSNTMMCMDVDNWSSRKNLIHPTRSNVRVAMLTEAGRISIQRALL